MSTNAAIVNPNEHLQIPAWINVDYFWNVLKCDEPNVRKVIKFTPIAAIPPGENFVSIMVRIHMELAMKDGAIKHKTYILKTMLNYDEGGALIEKLQFFPKEMKMYQRYIPAFEQLYKAAGKHIKFAPVCLLTEQQQQHKGGGINFIFEDLQVQNFRLANRLQGFNMNEMRCILKKLAEFHAASAVFAEQYGAFPVEFNCGFVDKERGYDYHVNTFTNKVEDYKKAMAQWDLPDIEKYIRKFPTFEQYWKCCLKSLHIDPQGFNVLNHGDFWSSNIMLTYFEDGTVDQVIFLDFQICKWGSPVEDLMFLITVSAAKDIRIKEFDHFVDIYHEYLIENLKLLKYRKPLPQLRDLHTALLTNTSSFNAFLATYLHLVVVLLPTDKDSNIHSILRNDEVGAQFRMRAFTNPLYVETMKDLFPFFHQRGLFNFEDYD